MSPAPNMTRKRSQRESQITTAGGSVAAEPRKMARKPLSSRSDSQPKAVKDLARVDIGKVDGPEEEPDEHRAGGPELLGKTGHGGYGEEDAGPGETGKGAVVGKEVEDAGGVPERNLPHEAGGGQQPVLAAQRAELVQRHEKRDQVDAAEPPLQQQPGKPEPRDCP